MRAVSSGVGVGVVSGSDQAELEAGSAAQVHDQATRLRVKHASLLEGLHGLDRDVIRRRVGITAPPYVGVVGSEGVIAIARAAEQGDEDLFERAFGRVHELDCAAGVTTSMS